MSATSRVVGRPGADNAIFAKRDSIPLLIESLSLLIMGPNA